jgi:hypothetical protein
MGRGGVKCLKTIVNTFMRDNTNWIDLPVMLLAKKLGVM